MKTRNAHKNAKLRLAKISIVDLTPSEMQYVNGGISVVVGSDTPGVAANTGTGGGGTNTLQTTTRTVQSMAPSAPCTGEPATGPYFTTISTFSVV